MDVVHTLVRRWYLTVPLLAVAVGLALGAFVTVHPTWERTATVVLLPDKVSVPDEGNPYLYLSGLSSVADVLTRASASQSFLDAVGDAAPGTEVTIDRDPTTSSPVIVVTVSSPSDAVAASMLTQAVDHVSETLERLQADEGLGVDRRITAATLSVDVKGTAVQRTRLLIAGVVGVAGVVLAVVVPTAVEGLSRRRRRRPRREGIAGPGTVVAAEDELVVAWDGDADAATDAASPVTGGPGTTVSVSAAVTGDADATASVPVVVTDDADQATDATASGGAVDTVALAEPAAEPVDGASAPDVAGEGTAPHDAHGSVNETDASADEPASADGPAPAEQTASADGAAPAGDAESGAAADETAPAGDESAAPHAPRRTKRDTRHDTKGETTPEAKQATTRETKRATTREAKRATARDAKRATTRDAKRGTTPAATKRGATQPATKRETAHETKRGSTHETKPATSETRREGSETEHDTPHEDQPARDRVQSGA